MNVSVNRNRNVVSHVMPHTDPSEGPIEEDLLFGTETGPSLPSNHQRENSRKRRSSGTNVRKRIAKKLRVKSNHSAMRERESEVEELTQNGSDTMTILPEKESEVEDLTQNDYDIMNDTVSNDATATVYTTNAVVESESEYVDPTMIEEVQKSGYRGNNPMRNQINYNNKTYNYIRSSKPKNALTDQIVFYYTCRARLATKKCGATIHICYENEDARSNKRFSVKVGSNKHTCGETNGPERTNCKIHKDLTNEMYLTMSQASLLPSNAKKTPLELAMEISSQFMHDNYGKF